MNDNLVRQSNQEQQGAAKPLVAMCFAPLVVKTLTIRCKVQPEAYAWLDQAAREVNTVWNFANATSYESISSYTRKSLPPANPKNTKKKSLQRRANLIKRRFCKLNPLVRPSQQRHHTQSKRDGFLHLI